MGIIHIHHAVLCTYIYIYLLDMEMIVIRTVGLVHCCMRKYLNVHGKC